MQALPAELGRLQRLQTLSAGGNDIVTVPPDLLGGCLALQTLSLHGCPITFAVSWYGCMSVCSCRARHEMSCVWQGGSLLRLSLESWACG